MFFRHEELNFRFRFQMIVNNNWIVELFFSFSFCKNQMKNIIRKTNSINNVCEQQFERWTFFLNRSSARFYTKFFHIWCFFIWKNRFRADFVFENCYKQQINWKSKMFFSFSFCRNQMKNIIFEKIVFINCFS